MRCPARTHDLIVPLLPPQVLAMLLLVFVSTAILSSVFLSLTIAFACYASIPPRTMAFTLLAVGAEAPDCIVNFIASKCVRQPLLFSPVASFLRSLQKSVVRFGK
jgi:hypothetical protein